MCYPPVLHVPAPEHDEAMFAMPAHPLFFFGRVCEWCLVEVRGQIRSNAGRAGPVLSRLASCQIETEKRLGPRANIGCGCNITLSSPSPPHLELFSSSCLPSLPNLGLSSTSLFFVFLKRSCVSFFSSPAARVLLSFIVQLAWLHTLI